MNNKYNQLPPNKQYGEQHRYTYRAQDLNKTDASVRCIDCNKFISFKKYANNGHQCYLCGNIQIG